MAKLAAKTYGEALFETALEGKCMDALAEETEGVRRVLEENPSIQVVIDLHRDEMPETTRLVTDLDGRPTARFMFFNGLSRTKTT